MPTSFNKLLSGKTREYIIVHSCFAFIFLSQSKFYYILTLQLRDSHEQLIYRKYTYDLQIFPQEQDKMKITCYHFEGLCDNLQVNNNHFILRVWRKLHNVCCWCHCLLGPTKNQKKKKKYRSRSLTLYQLWSSRTSKKKNQKIEVVVVCFFPE